MKLLTVSCLSMFSAALMAAEESSSSGVPPSAQVKNSVPPKPNAVEDEVSLWDLPVPALKDAACDPTEKAAIRIEYNPLTATGGDPAGGSRGSTDQISFTAFYDGVFTHRDLKLLSSLFPPFDPAAWERSPFQFLYRF